MKSVVVILNIIILIVEVQHVTSAVTTTADRIKAAGYGSETHTIFTKDGYGLTVFRIIGRGNRTTSSPTAPVVLMMHGLMSSSDCWVLQGLKDGLAYNMVDRGYDVWLGNARGNTYGKRHRKLSLDSPKFWNFSWHEIGIIDLPTTMDYILQKTQQPRLHYVGHSPGTTIMFVLLSIQPKYSEKLKSLHMIAPIAYLKHTRSPAVLTAVPLVRMHTPLDNLVSYTTSRYLPIGGMLFKTCINPRASRELCDVLTALLNGGMSDYIQKSIFPDVFKTHPASTSARQSFHFVQLHISGHFRQYDFGAELNLQYYNRTTTPDYDVQRIQPRFPFHFYYSDFDDFSTKLDVEKFSKILGNRSISHFINLKKFAHFDFMWAHNIKKIINPVVLKIMQETEEAWRNEER
ncbi:lipase 3-like [Musca domestica]|uniref:Lipase n=1 Tax=Musca domestica TaxID=7370 RepID=A0A1I8MR72_MUSDO|nr:lipase 3-like [Musca domestica]